MKKLIRAAFLFLGYDVVAHDDHATPGKLLRALLESRRINCVIDVGAHTGEFGRHIRRFGYTGDIVSFEPVAANYALLQRTAEGDPRWRTHQMALGDASGSAPINVARNTVFSSFLLATALATDSFGDKPEIESLEIVSVRRLDGILDEVISHVDRPRVFLKIDAQGYDMRVLEGASGVLSRIEGIQTELSVQPIYHGAPPISEALSRLDAMGFDLAGLYPVGRDAALRVIEFDAMLIRRPGALPSGLDAQRPSFERQVQAA